MKYFQSALLLPVFVVLTTGMSPSTSMAENDSPRKTSPLPTWDFTSDTFTAGVPAALPPAATWSRVQIPHIFRLSGLPDNSAGWYRQTIITTEADRGHRFLLLLEGAATVKDVFVNGQHVGQHKGAYTASAFDLTPALEYGTTNILTLRVSNRDAEVQGTMARSSLYYVNGGMFRKAWLVKTGAIHISPELGSCGIYLTPSNITPARADLGVRTVVCNPLATPAEVQVQHVVTDPAGAQAASFSTTATIPAGQTVTLDATGTISNPQLWDLQHPALYTVRTDVLAGGRPGDSITETTGFRTIAWTANRFHLNGREVQFRGVNKHAQDEYSWNAVTDDKLRLEWRWMTDMGVNAVRLAHYPHARLEYDLADRNGIAIWAENGYAGHNWAKNMEGDRNPTPDNERQTREMVRQNWNHPSILFWSCGNETIPKTAARYADVIRAEKDPGRLITYANAIGFPKNCDFIANNTYDGWYGSRNYNDFNELPRNALVSETGASCWISHHVPYGTALWSVDKFEPEEYTEIFTEYRLQTICRNDITNRPMFFWWNFREFYNNKFKDNRNSKGLVTLAGLPKDIAFLFQAFFRPGEPLVHLNGRHHFLRRFAADNGIKAFASVPALELTVNGVSQGWKTNGEYRIPDIKVKGGKKTLAGIPVEHVFFWKAPLTPGRNCIEVSDGVGHSDMMVVYQQPASGPMPEAPAALVQELRSSNPSTPAAFIDRPVEAQSPFYTQVDGSSDNTFDVLPASLVGASWIGTPRLSDPERKTDISFRIHAASKGAKVCVMFSTGTHPLVTLKPPSPDIAKNAAAFARSLAAAGFIDSGEKAVWRDHNLERAETTLWNRALKPGESLVIPGQVLDYVILVKGVTGSASATASPFPTKPRGAMSPAT